MSFAERIGMELRDQDAIRLKTFGNQDLVAHWHKLYGYAVNDTPTTLTMNEMDFRLGLIQEEYNELRDELIHIRPNVVKVAHEAADVIFVLYGLACEMGFDLDACVREVYRANMTKDRAEVGKATKGEGFVPADIDRIVNG